MRTIAIDDPGVCQSVTRAGCAKTAERIDVLFGVKTHGDPKNIALHGGAHLLTVKGRGFDAAFAKLLWPLVITSLLRIYMCARWSVCLSVCSGCNFRMP